MKISNFPLHTAADDPNTNPDDGFRRREVAEDDDDGGREAGGGDEGENHYEQVPEN